MIQAVTLQDTASSKKKELFAACSIRRNQNPQRFTFIRNVDFCLSAAFRSDFSGRASVYRAGKYFLRKNVRSLIKQAQVRGVVILASADKMIDIFEYSPLEIKKAVVGYGRAEKRQVQVMVKAILKLPELPPADAADALATAICHANFFKEKPI